MKCLPAVLYTKKNQEKRKRQEAALRLWISRGPISYLRSIASSFWKLAKLAGKNETRRGKKRNSRLTASFSFRRCLPLPTSIAFAIIGSLPCFGFRLLLLDSPLPYWRTRVIFTIRAKPLAVGDRIKRWAKTLQMPRSVALFETNSI